MRREISQRRLYFLGVLVILIQGCGGFNPSSVFFPSTVSVPEVNLRKGIQAYEEGNYDQANVIFQDLIAKYPGSTILSEVQWMLGRTYERQGLFKQAFTEYNGLLYNFPQTTHKKEALNRIDFLSEVLRESDQEKTYPLVLGIEIRGDFPSQSQLNIQQKNGFNAVLLEAASYPKEAWTKNVFDFISIARKAKFMAFARIEIDPLLLFEQERKNDLKLQMFEISIAGFDGVFFSGFVSSSEQILVEKTVDQFNRDLRLNYDKDEVLADPSAYWKWAGWRSRQTMKILTDSVLPIFKTQAHFSWGIIYPSDALRVPHQILAERGLDMLEAKQQGMDYFGIIAPDENMTQVLLPMAQDLIGEPSRVIVFLDPPDSRFMGKPPLKLSGSGMVYLSTDR